MNDIQSMGIVGVLHLSTRKPNCQTMTTIFYLLRNAFKRYSRNVHDLDLMIGPRSDDNMLIEIPYAISYLMAIVMFATSVTVCQIITYELPNVVHLNLLPENESQEH